MEKQYDDQGCWKLLQQIIYNTFSDATDRKKARDILAWAQQRPNKILYCFSEIGEYDYDQVVKSLVSRCEKTLQ